MSFVKGVFKSIKRNSFFNSSIRLKSVNRIESVRSYLYIIGILCLHKWLLVVDHE